jgi:hypothetical protein
MPATPGNIVGNQEDQVRAAPAEKMLRGLSRMPRGALLILLLLVAGGVGVSPAHAKDCGRLPQGKNPTPDEIGKLMDQLSVKYSVPTEILKGIAFQESGVQQWRADGSFVYNTGDCGLGMMQLTGSTAQQYDVEKLKDDWKYNLECGVKVLCEKWDRACREGKVTADPADRKLLENWYYPVQLYQGRANETYVTTVFTHIEKRPGVLQKLLSRSVEITFPQKAITGWTFGKKFHALDGNKFTDESGQVFKAPTHKGTIGDEQEVARLEILVTKAKKALEKNHLAEAVSLLAQACSVELELEPRVRARALLDVLEKRGEDDLRRADEVAESDRKKAIEIARKVEKDFAPVPLGKKAKAKAEELAKAPAGAQSNGEPPSSNGEPPSADPPRPRED